VVNWALVEQRRIARGLTHHEPAAQAGSGVPSSSARLWREDDHDAMPMIVLERLCAVLDLHPVELFTPATRAAAPAALPPPRDQIASDDVVVEAALATVAAAGAACRSARPGWPRRWAGRWTGRPPRWPHSTTA
jgi:hypothetical protein